VKVVTTSPKGQVVIPKEEREKIGIKPGSKVAVELVNDHIEIYPLPDNPVEHFCGIFREGGSLTKALIRERKEESGREEEKAARFIRSSGLSKKRKRP
jgi:AbrB family looped-hinge helix DNA binding protein